MMEQPKPTDDIAAAKHCLAVYGANLERWPADARERWGKLAVSDSLKENFNDAEVLDALLNAATSPQTPHDLKNRIEAGYRPPTEKAAGVISGLGALSGWLRPLPAGAFASMAAAGFITASVMESGPTLAPEYEAYAYLEDSGFASLYDETGALWDAE